MQSHSCAWLFFYQCSMHNTATTRALRVRTCTYPACLASACAVDDLYNVRGQLCETAQGMHSHAYAITRAWSMGMAAMANKNTLFVTLVSRATRFEAHWCRFIVKFNRFVVLTSPSGAYILRSGNFLWTTMTQSITSPLAHACRAMKHYRAKLSARLQAIQSIV